MLNRTIVFLRFNHFYLTALSAVGRGSSSSPVIVVKDGLVLDLDQEAEKWGVKRGDKALQANRRCPGLTSIDFNPDDYQALYELVWNILAEITPIVEPVDFDRGFLDLTGCGKHSGCKSVAELMRITDEKLYAAASLRLNWGGGQDKWIARLAGDANRYIQAKQEAAFLDKVSIRQLGIPDEPAERFRYYSICTVGQLATVPDAFLQSHLQLAKEEIRQLRSRDTTAVRALYPPVILQEKVVLLSDTQDDTEAALQMLSDKLETELSSRSLQAGTIELIIECKPNNFSVERKLSRPCCTQDQLNRLLHELLPEQKQTTWREIRVTLSNLSPRFQPQEDLWQKRHSITEVNHPLYAASERLQKKFGFQVLRSGTEYSHSMPPRFAQLIYEQRGINLP